MIGNIGEELPLADKNRNRITMREVRQQRQEFVTDAITEKCGILVGRIMERLDASERADRLGVVTAQFHNGMARSGTDAREPIRTCSAQQIHEHRLGPIIGSVSKRCIRSEDFETSSTCPSLEVRPRLDAHCFGPKSGPNPLCHGRDQVGFVMRPGPQSVIDMHCGHLTARGHGQKQKRQRIGASGDTAGQSCSCLRKMTARKQIAMALAQRINLSGHGIGRCTVNQAAPSGARMRSIQR